jgi:Leucine-rich repeat (LRR) protein
MRFALFGTFVLGLIAFATQTRAADPTPTADEKKSIDLVVKAGGKAVIDPNLPAPARVSAKFEAATDTTLIGLKKATAIGALDVYDATRIPEKGFVALKDLPNLRKLTLGKSEMNLARATAIGRCKELRVLFLGGSGLTDAGLTGLKTLTHLESLDISDNPLVTNKGMATVKTLERLQTLHLAKTGVGDEGLMALLGLDGLRSLNVSDSKVTAEAAEKFADEMPNLRGVRR